MFVIEFSSLTDDAVIELASNKLKTCLADWERDIWQFLSDWFNPSISSVKVFTSGSTGAPKQMEHNKQAMIKSAQMTCEALQLEKGDNALFCLPANKIAGMMMIVRSIYCRMNLICIKPSSNPLNELMGEMKIAFAAFTPMQLFSAVNNNEHLRKAEQIDKLILGGENISAGILQTVLRFSNKVYATFGMTETISHIALKKLNGKNADTHFKVLEGIKISADERNCLVIEAPALGQPHLVTNDVVRIISDNEFDWLGRADNVINSGGVKIHPEELEQKLQQHIQSAFFIASVPDERTGEKLVLAIEAIELSESDTQRLTQAFAELDKLHRPKSVLLFHRFTRTANGKIKRKETLQNTYETVAL